MSSKQADPWTQWLDQTWRILRILVGLVILLKAANSLGVVTG